MDFESRTNDLFRRNQKRLWTFLYRLARDVQDAEDLLQNTFLRFFEEEQRGRIPRGQELAVLHRLGYQSFVDLYRRNRRDAGRSAPLSRLTMEGEGPGLERGLSRALDRALSDGTPLNERQRGLLCLRALGALSPGEARAALDIPRQTYYRDMEKAAAVLRQFLKDEGFNASGEELP